MLTTGAMVKIGKTYKNFMIDVKPTNTKLKDRAVRITAQIAEADYETAKNLLEQNNYKIKESILQLKYNIDFNKAQELLKAENGIIRRVFEKNN